MYHFLSGYTAKVAGTEIGVTEPRGDLLDLLRRAVHAAPPVGLRQSAQGADRQGRRRLLAGQHRLDRRQVWRRQAHADQGDPRAAQRRARRQPERTPSSARTRISASKCRSRCRASTAAILDPRGTWADTADYDATAAKLVDLFVENFAQFADHVDEGVRQAAPEGTRNDKRNTSQTASHRRLRPGRRSGPPKDPINDRLPTPTSSRPTPRSSISAKACSRAPCRAPNGPTKRISPRPPICCCSRPDIDLDTELAGHHPPLQRERRRREQRHRRLSRDDHARCSCTASGCSWRKRTRASRCTNSSTSCCCRRWAGATGRCASIRRPAVLR